jgi:hypothetical protein
MSKEEISNILQDNLQVVPTRWDMHEKHFNCGCHFTITDKAYQIIGEGDTKRGKHIVDQYLIESNGNI